MKGVNPTVPLLADVSTERFLEVVRTAPDVEAAAAMLGVTPRTVRNETTRRALPSVAEIRKAAGFKRRHSAHSVWTDDQNARLIELHAQGLSATLIGQDLGFSKNAVIGKARRMGITLGTPTSMAINPVPAPRQSQPKSPPPPFRPAPAPKPSITLLKKIAVQKAAIANHAADRAMIDAAIAEGRITRLPPGHAWGTQKTWDLRI